MFLRTTRYGKNGHSHIAYLPVDENGAVLRPQSQTSIDRKHGHGLLYHEPMPAVDDLGQPVVDEQGQPIQATEGYWEVMPAEDGHTHELAGEVERTEEKDDHTDEEKVQKARDLFKAAMDYEKEAREKAEEAERFYAGEQWEESDRSLLRSQNRACLTINHVEVAVDTLSGYQRQNRTDTKFLPVEEGDAVVADIYTALLKNIYEQNDFEYVETDVFEDGVVVGRGFFHPYIDYDKNLEGDIVIESFHWADGYAGPHEKKDLSDCEFIAKSKWYNKKRIKQMWPEKADEIQADYESLLEGQPITHQRIPGDQYNADNNNVVAAQVTHDPTYVDVAKKEYRVVEVEVRKPRRVPVLVHDEDGFTLSGDGWKSADLRAVKSIPGFHTIHRRVDNMQTLTIAGSVLLDESTTDDTEFSLIPFYAKKKRGTWWGKVETAKDAQREVNKRRSQSIDVVNKAASYGWFHDDRTFPGPLEARQFEENAAKPGFVQKIASTDRPPTKVEGSRVPAEIVAMEQASLQSLREVMNVNNELLGQQSQAISGIAMVERKKQALLGNEYLFDNLAFTKKLLGRRMVRLIQQVYTPERIIRVLEHRNARMPVQIGGQPMSKYDPEELQHILSEQDITKYDIVVGESAFSPTNRMANFILLLEMARAGLPIPPDVQIENSPMPQDVRERIMQAMAQQAQAAQQAEAAKQDSEMVKSMPDEVKVQEFFNMKAQREGQPMG